MAIEKNKVSLKVVSGKFIAQLSKAEAKCTQPEVDDFMGWFKNKLNFDCIVPIEIASYAERFSSEDIESHRKLDVLRKLLIFAFEEGYCSKDLSVSLKAKAPAAAIKTKAVRTQAQSDKGVMTQQGYEEIMEELRVLRARRPIVLEDVRRAASDKDFRENAPLHAAREQLGYIEGRTKELEAIIRNATIINKEDSGFGVVSLGDAVTIVGVISGKSLRYKIVGPKEANPVEGKISHVSPIGSALIGRRKGDVINVVAPAGVVQYRIVDVEH